MFKFKKMKIRTKLILSYTILLIIIISVGVFGIVQIGMLNSQISNVININVKQSEAITGSQKDLKAEVILVDSLIMGQNVTIKDYTAQHSELMVEYNLLAKLCSGTNIENNVTNLSSNLNSLSNMSTDSGQGIFYLVNTQFNLTNSLQMKVNQFESNYKSFMSFLSLIKLELTQYANQTAQPVNSTITDTLMSINMMTTSIKETITDTLINNRNFTPTTINSITMMENMVTMNINKVEMISNQSLSSNQINQTIFNNLNNIGSQFIYSGNSATIMGMLKNSNDGIIAVQNNLIMTKLNVANTRSQIDNLGSNISSTLSNIELWINSNLKIKEQTTADLFNLSVVFLSLIIISSTIIAGLLAILITRNIVPYLSKLVKINSKLAEGDITVETISIDENRDDEISLLTNSTNILTNSFKTILTKINNASGVLASSSKQIANSAEEVNATSEEISAISQQLAKGSQAQASQVQDTQKQSELLQKTFEEKIAEINHTSEIINSISSQINMLALNASIEAARAGEYGRGFAVVADNIRRLADNTKDSVQQVQTTIKDLSSSIHLSIENISKSIDSLASLTEENASSSEESSASIEEQAASLEELTASTQDLYTTASDLSIIVRNFKL